MALKIFKIPDPLANVAASANPKLLITGAAINAIKGKILNIPERELEESIATSDFGTPIYDYLNIRSGSYTKLDGTIEKYEGLIFDVVLIEVNMQKNIIKTPLQGRNGTVKEYVSDGDFVINVSGLISSKDNVYPEEKMRKFKALMSVPQQLEIASDYLNSTFGIDNIVIESYNSRQIEGTRNQIAIAFQAVSDEPLDIEVLDADVSFTF